MYHFRMCTTPDRHFIVTMVNRRTRRNRHIQRYQPTSIISLPTLRIAQIARIIMLMELLSFIYRPPPSTVQCEVLMLHHSSSLQMYTD